MDITPLIRPTSNDRDQWKAYWTAQGELWRTDPEISEERQRELAERRDTIKPDFEKGIYPFKDFRLTRADIEWLLHEHGPIDWQDVAQRSRNGIDIRGAILDEIDLSVLPLTQIMGSISYAERGFYQGAKITTREQRYESTASMRNVNLSFAHLEGAQLSRVHFEYANLELASLQGADLVGAYFYGATLRGANVAGANLVRIRLDRETHLSELILGNTTEGVAYLHDANWGETNLGIINWHRVPIIGEEQLARQKLTRLGKVKTREQVVHDWQQAVKGYRQIAYALRSQGLNEEADCYAYRSKRSNRIRLWKERRLLAATGSYFLDLISGYGFQVWKSIAWYVSIIGIFAFIFSFLSSDPNFLGSIVDSILSFHGRGLAPNMTFQSSSPIAVLSAVEAVIGFVFEISFIATFTQRFFSR